MKKTLIITGKILLGILITIVAVIIILLVARLIGKSINSKTPDGGINESMYVDINGTKQWINIYGQDKGNPVLLYLHGGPGTATSWLDWSILRSLSEDYTVVGWDQRGFGHNYPEYAENELPSAEMFLQDGLEMTDYLREYLGKEKITLLGHSWGSVYASNLALEYPEKYDAVIAMSLMVDMPESKAMFKEWALEHSANDPELHAIAEKIDPSMIVTDEEQEDILDRLDEAYNFTDDYFKDSDKNLYAALWFNPNCTLKQQLTAMGMSQKYTDYQLKLIGGERCTIAFPMVQSLSIKDRTNYEVPYYVIVGTKDHGSINMVEEAEAYFEKVDAPDKELFYIEGGHVAPLLKTKELSEYVHTIAEKQRNR
ncbi:alpha/beta fold hydrolase [Ruminococcus sp.]|uniref:alpha/beta hydrolase n=1 Tax=Ruminococcus sp. TaxID=41978 RepID=UPI001B2EA496|nr:alpha/beta fold hydrolase [Ruminococcus sp.]MBO5558762.1 alpha/beta fold hydrolase [Ruminococcus sp.]